jgi:hypothetical protein
MADGHDESKTRKSEDSGEPIDHSINMIQIKDRQRRLLELANPAA